MLKDGVSETTKTSRLTLSAKVASTLETGLNLLGIDVMEQM